MNFQKIKYAPILFKILISFIAAHIVVSLGEERSIFQLMFLKAYYVALGVSAFIAFVILEFIAASYSFLDEILPWGYLNIMRLIVQIATCVGLPLTFAIILAICYYEYHHIHISQTGYFLYVFKFVVPYVLVINFYYNKEWISSSWTSNKLEPVRTDESNPDETVNVNGEAIKNNDVAIVFIELRACLAKK